MGRVGQNSRNWPDNGITNAADTNTYYNEIQLQSGQIDAGNVRTEGVDTRNFVVDAQVKWAGSQRNLAEFPLGLTPLPAGANYQNYSDDGVREYPVNHNAAGTPVTTPGLGTKLIVGGPAGIVLAANDIIRVKWTAQVFKTRGNVNGSGNQVRLNMHASDLITTTARADGALDGSGVGEWCYLLYPKVNVTSNVLTDADFLTVSNANLYYAAVADPKVVVPGQGGALNAAAFFPHVSVCPICILTQGTSVDDPGYTYEATGDNQALSGIRRPYTVSGSITLKASGAVTLYGIQLYASGIWRMTATAANGQLYLEDHECDPVHVFPKFGVSQTIVISSAQISAIIHKNSHTP